MTARNHGFFVALLSRFWHNVTARNLGFLPHFCHGFDTLRQRQGRVFCLTFVPVCPAETAAKPRFLSYFCRGFVAAARAFSFAHRERRKHKTAPALLRVRRGCSLDFACNGSKCPCSAFYVSLEDFHDSTQKSRLRGAQTLSNGIASHGHIKRAAV